MMKTVLMAILCRGVIVPALFAQDGGRGRTLTATAGLNSSRFSEQNSENVDCLRCLSLALDFIFGRSGSIFFSSGMLYTPSGSEYRFGEGEGYSVKTRSALGYLNFPLEAQYEFDAGRFKPFVRGGGVFGVLLAAKNKTTTEFGGQKDETETDIKNQKKSTNLGLSLGGGVSFPLGKFHGVANVRYLIGLTNVVKDDKAPSAKTRDLTYSVGIGIPVF
jgi:opacity protein-like surface antigen